MDYNLILKILRQFGESHLDIQRFISNVNDEMSEVVSKGQGFPVMYVEPLSITQLEYMDRFTLRVYVFDRRMKDKSNINYNLTSTSQIIRELGTWLMDSQEMDITVDNEPIAYPFLNELMTDVDGWFTDLELLVEKVTLCDLPVSTCLEPIKEKCNPIGTVNIYNSEGALLGTSEIIGGQIFAYTVPDSVITVDDTGGDILRVISVPATENGYLTIQDSTYSIFDKNGAEIESGSILAEGHKDITINQELIIPVKNTLDETVGSIVNGEILVGDSPYVIVDSLGVTLHSGNIPAENSLNQTISDSQVIVKDSKGVTLYNDVVTAQGSVTLNISDSKTLIYDSDGNLLKQIDVEAEGTKNATIADSTSIIKDSDGNIIHNVSILAEGSKETIISDSKSVIKDSTGATLTTTSILAQGSADTTIADSTYVVKNQDGDVIAQGSILAEGSVEIVVESFRGNRPLILTYNTNLYTDAIIQLPGTGYDLKDIVVKDSLGVVVKSLVGITDDNIQITDLPVGIYDVEVSMPETSRMGFYSLSYERVNATLVEVKQWGDVIWDENLHSLFAYNNNLIITADDTMKISVVDVTNATMSGAFWGIAGITNMDWVEALPFYAMSNISELFIVANGIKDVVLDFNNASHLTNINSMFLSYQGMGEYESIIINNMGSTLTAMGDIILPYDTIPEGVSIPTLHTLIYNDLQISQNITGFTNGTAQAYVDFFDAIGDRSGKDQRTITMRVGDWNKLDAGQQAYVNQLLIDKNWAIAY